MLARLQLKKTLLSSKSPALTSAPLRSFSVHLTEKLQPKMELDPEEVTKYGTFKVS